LNIEQIRTGTPAENDEFIKWGENSISEMENYEQKCLSFNFESFEKNHRTKTGAKPDLWN
jgi:hypothetical protein